MPNQPEDKRKQEETDELILKNVYFFFYAQSSSYEDDVLFDNPQTDYSMCIEDYETFLGQHFAGYLSLVKEGKARKICGIEIANGVNEDHYVSDARGDLFTGRKTCKRRGHRIRKNLIRKINEKKYDNNFSEVIDEIEKKNSEVLRQWDLNPVVVKKKLLKFIERMHTGTRTGQIELIEIDQKLQNTIMSLIEEQVHSGNTLESMATPITWLLLAALLRGYISGLEDYYMNMGKRPERSFEKDLAEKNLEGYEAVAKSQREINCSNRDSIHGDSICSQPRYTNPDDIRPYTMENIGNLRNTYVKRENLLKQLHQKMHGRQQNDRLGKQYVFISGIGGEGKTELARAYAYTYRNEYDEIFWFTCVDEEMTGIEMLLEGSDYSKTVTPEILHSLDERCLLILDNCNSVASSTLRELIDKTGRAHLLVTTRLAGITQIHPNHFLYFREDIQEKNAFACQIFAANYLAEPRSWYGEFWDGSEESGIHSTSADHDWISSFTSDEKADIEIICKLVWNHPMTVAIVAVMLRENRDTESISSFSAKCRGGLTNAFPSYEIPFGQGAEDYDKEPLEILRALFASFPKRGFTLSERKLLTILQMVPARQIDMKYICELLGDDEQQKDIRNACRSLSSLNWLQSNGIWITMHPLLGQVLEWEQNRIRMDNDEVVKKFYRDVMERWMISMIEEQEKTDYCSYLGYRIWEKSGIIEEQSSLNLAIRLLINKQKSKDYLESMNPDLSCGFTAIVYGSDEIAFLCYDLQKKEERKIYSLQMRRKRSKKERNEVELLFLTCGEEQMELQFPNELAGSPILEIPDNFCRNNLRIISLKFPEKLEKIGDHAFWECKNISGNLDLPESLKKLGDYAFGDCEKLSGGLTVHGNLKEIGRWAFYNCGLDGKLIIEEGVREIKEAAFSNARFTGYVRFPIGLESIGKEAFMACSGLTGIELPEGVKGIYDGAFLGCRKLNGNLELPDTLEIIGDSAFEGCSQLCGDLKIPESVMHIGARAFCGCENLSGELIIPPEIKIIYGETFFGCNKLKLGQSTFHNKMEEIGFLSFTGCLFVSEELKFPDSLRRICNSAFSLCKGIRSIEFGNGLETIGREAFFRCPDLESIKFPSNLKAIEYSAFQECVSLQEISVFPDSLEIIGHHAFYDCINLKVPSCLPDSLRVLGDYAFANCCVLTGIPQIPDTLIYRGKNIFCDCGKLEYSETKVLNNQCSCINDEGELLIPESMTELSFSWLHSWEEQLPEAIKIPDYIVKIGKEAFVGKANKLKIVILPLSLEEIGEKAFCICTNLIKISSLPSGVKRIKDQAFDRCRSLVGIDELPPSLEEIGRAAFRDCRLLFNSLTIPDAIERINDYSFMRCMSLTDVIFSKRLREIGKYAFSGCVCLKEIIFPESLIEIGKSAFEQCTGLKKICFSEGLQEIGYRAFAGDESLHGILELPESLRKVGQGAFQGCSYSQIVIKNPDMEFDKLCDGENLVIWGHENSTALEYAMKNNYQFRSITEWPGIEAFEDEN